MLHTCVCKVKVRVTQSCPTLWDPMDYTVHGILQAKILEWVAFPFSRGSFQPQYPDLLADSLPAEPQEESRYIGMGSVFLLQQIFLTQISNWGLLHCRQILYQLSYQESPKFSSVAQACLTLCDRITHSMTDLPLHHQLPEFT